MVGLRGFVWGLIKFGLGIILGLIRVSSRASGLTR